MSEKIKQMRIEDQKVDLENLDDEYLFVRAAMEWPEITDNEVVREDDFFNLQLQRIFVAIKHLHVEGITVDRNELIHFDDGISNQTLDDLKRIKAPRRNVPVYEKRLVKRAKLRALKQYGVSITEVAGHGSKPEDVVAYAYSELERIENTDESEDISALDLGKEYEMEMANRDQRVDGIKIRIKKIDDHTGGFYPGDFIVIGAFTNDGKSALKMNFAITMALAGNPVGIITMEDSAQKYRNRMMSFLSGVNAKIIRDCDVSGMSMNEAQALVEAQSIFKKLPITFSYKPGMTISEIEAKARLWVKRYGIKVLFVDYIQIVENPGHPTLRESLMSTVSRLTALSRRLGIILVTSSQINRGGESNPRLSNLAETSKIEHQADYVFLIEAEDVVLGNNESIRVPTKIVLAKGRDVPKGLKIDVHFDRNRMKFIQVDRGNPEHRFYVK